MKTTSKYLLAITIAAALMASATHMIKQDSVNDIKELKERLHVLDYELDLLDARIEELNQIQTSTSTTKKQVTINSSTTITSMITDYDALRGFMIEHNLDQFIMPDTLYILSQYYQVDAGFALSTFVLETGWGKSKPWLTKNNPAGIMCGGSYCEYTSEFDGFEAMFDLLEKYTSGSISYVGTKNTVDEVRSTWSEADDTRIIVEIWNNIAKYENKDA